ncbi:MAG TPA: DUF2207 domain-containing protein [Streptosporangiaceae bacterium]|jgi:hypothetical protein|nr:DUF2207 domain-containing protein [Streptosporangiaceae bacterium]
MLGRLRLAPAPAHFAGVAHLTGVVCLASVSYLAGFAAPAPAAAASAPAASAAVSQRVVKDSVALTVRPDGVVHAKETVTYDFAGGGTSIERAFLVKTRDSDRRDRIFKIENIKATAGAGGGPATVSTVADGDTMIVRVSGPRTTGTRSTVLEYDIRGAISATGSGQELRWTAVGGWDVPVAEARVTVDAPAVVSNLNCFAGELTSSIGCTQFFTNHTHTRGEFVQQNLLPQEYLTVAVGYPPNMTKAMPLYERRHTLATAFTVNGITGGALVALLVLLLGGLALLYQLRGRDSRIVGQKAAEGDHAPVAADGTHFEPPDGVRPGQVGTLVDEQADVIDVTATIVDLAVRGYLLIEELPREAYGRLDWKLRKLDRPTGELLLYERMLYAALFDGRDEIRLSQLGGTFTEQLARVRSALYEDVVKQGWFGRRPDAERTRWTTTGMILTAVGVVGTVLLAIFTDLALIGLAVIIAGAALTLGGQHMPAKTARGATVLAHTIGFRAYLYRGEAEDVPEDQRLSVFSRYLPYAVVFDAVQRWAKTVEDVGVREKGADNLYWYEGPAEWDLSKFAESMRIFTLATSGAISQARQFRSLS